ncbi:outer membrane lipoprotein, partial [Haemophilus influenzae]
SNT